MSVGPKETADMARILASMYANEPSQPAAPIGAPGHLTEAMMAHGMDAPVEMPRDADFSNYTGHLPDPTPAGSAIPSTHFVGDAQKDDMRSILSRFYTATDRAVTNLVEDSKTNRPLREAMMMQKTETGARIGEWDITTRMAAGRKFYDITRGDERIAADLTLYEAALGIVRALNSGKYVNSPEVLSILRDEQEYSAALDDAIRFKKLITENREPKKKIVREARYSEAKSKAISARDRIRERVKDLED